MRIDGIALKNFRNYLDESVQFDPVCNVIYGENAQGKTNLLEAIVYLSSAHSPRSRRDKELIRFESEDCSISGQIWSREREMQVQMQLHRGLRKKIWVNKVPVKKASELSGLLNTVYFCPDDLYLIRSGAAERRSFMDTSLCQLRPRYAEALAEYNRLYEHKTRILRDSEEKPDLLLTLPDFNQRMIAAGAMLIHYRARFARKVGEYAAVAHGECSGGREELTVRYETVSSITDPFAELSQLREELSAHQQSHYQAEIASRLCLSGPHKDDLDIQINGVSARSFGSQGQVRTAALALKLAEREIHKNATGEYPVLLLDDVLSELDEKRQEYVLNRIGGGQVFITCCEDDRLGTMLGGKVFHVKGGQIL